MKVSQLVSKRYKEIPADCQIESQALMMRGGYIKSVGNGIYTLFPIAKRIARKIEQILREEMDRIDGQEVLFPVVMPASLWQESGRYESIGSEMVRLRDRSGSEMVLGMTHEEAAVQLMRDTATSYVQYPFMIYQIQTKFRDEPRSRGGLLRVREFTMKDGYSFHTSQEDLEVYYARCYAAYNRFFARVGIPQIVTVQSDSGMMGGKIAHEYMLLTDIGEDSLALCRACDYRSNVESAPCIVRNDPGASEPLRKESTPGVKTIEALTEFFKLPATRFCKAVLYRENVSGKIVVVFLRGDLDVNETKLRNLLGVEVHPAELEDKDGLVAGFIGPIGLPSSCRFVMDQSIQGIESLITGANEADAHYAGFNVARDLGPVAYADVAKSYEGAICPQCGEAAIRISRGVELGNIFQLGTKYTESMNMQYIDEEGLLHHPIMGCYGIGVGRTMASVCEVYHDAYGPIWPISIAPWQVQVCSLRADHPEVVAVSAKLVDALEARGIEVLWDDRSVSAGVMFSDADLFGVPVRMIVSPKGLAGGTIEITTRTKAFTEKIEADKAVEFVSKYIQAEMDALSKVL